MSTAKPTPQVDMNTEKNPSQDIDVLLRDAFMQCSAPQDVCEATIERIHVLQAESSTQLQGSAQIQDSTQIQSPIQSRDSTQASPQPQTSKSKRAKIKRFPLARIVAAAAAVVLVGLCLVGYGTWNQVVTIVSIDVNPSLELSLNRFERVLDVRAVNEDAAELVKRADVVGMTCEDAVSEILGDEDIEQSVQKGIDEGYTEEQSAVAITVVPMHHSEHHGQACRQSAQRAIDQSASPCQLLEGSNEEYEAAAAVGLSVGKYRMYVKLQPDYPELTPEDVAQMPMRELRALAGEGCAGAGQCGSGTDICEEGVDQDNGERKQSCNGEGRHSRHGCNGK